MLTLQAMINGLSMGAGFGLLGLPVVLIFRATGVKNFAIGGLAVWAGLIGTTLLQGQSMWVAYPLLLVVCVVGPVALYQVCMRFVLGKSLVMGVMVTIAIGFALEGLAGALYGADSRSLRRIVPRQTFTIIDGRLSVTSDAIVALVVLGVVFVALKQILGRTQFGREMRAVSDDSTIAAATGIDVHRVLSKAYALLGVCIFIFAVVVLPSSAVNAFQGLHLLLGTMTAVLVGGLTRAEGAVVGGIIVGVVNSAAVTVLNPFVESLAAVALLLVVLGLRPNGIFVGLRGRDVA